MIGFEEPTAKSEYALMHGKSVDGVSAIVRANPRKSFAGALALVSLVIVGCLSTAGTYNLTLEAKAPAQWHGVSLGGWLLMEINPKSRIPTDPMDKRPSWMFDQIYGASELDFIVELRAEKGDEFTVQTMRNHWEGYITDEMLDDAVALGVDTMRIPMGYWIMDPPVGGTSPLEYGFTPEGFVSGGLNALHTMLVKLKKRGIGALIDIHSMPCNSACISDGLYCAAPLGFLGKGQAPIGDMERCEHAGGGTYKTLRVPKDGEREWVDVGVNSVGSLAKWLSELPEEAQTVIAFQLANEPALGPTTREIYLGILSFYERALVEARKHLPTVPLIFSFMGPTPDVRAVMLKVQAADKKAGGGGIIGDHHYYLDWQACCGTAPGVPALNSMPWDEIHRRTCRLEAEGNAHDIDVYGHVGLEVMVGEWSLATNLDAPMDLDDAETVAQLKHFYEEQLETFSSRKEIRGSFFWTLRMGSGWDPRPTAEHPNGVQLAGTSAWKSYAAYPFKIWSLLEMKRAKIAGPLNGLYLGTCAKNRCQGILGTCDIGLGKQPPAPPGLPADYVRDN